MIPFDEAWLTDHNAKMAKLRARPVKPAPSLIEFSLPFLLRLPNRTSGQHWARAYSYRKWLVGPVGEALRPWMGCLPMERARVTITRFSTHPVDDHNNAASLKPLIDLFLTKSNTHPHSMGCCVDDDPTHMETAALWERCRRIEQHTEVRIENLS